MIEVLFDFLGSLQANTFKCYEDRATRSYQSGASVQALMVGIPAWEAVLKGRPGLPLTVSRHSTLLCPKLETKGNKQKRGHQGTAQVPLPVHRALFSRPILMG